MNYEDLMRRAVALARSASAAHETAVGALVVWQGDIIGEGEERVRRLLDPSAHAEVMAIRAACQHRGSLDLDDGMLVTTVEPCVLCAYAIRRTRLELLLLGNGSAEEKVAMFLVSWRNRLARITSFSETVPLPMRRQDIADFLGLKLETVSRAFSKFQDEGILEVKQRQIRVLNPEALQALVNGTSC